MSNQNAKGLRRLINALSYSLAGFRACFQNEEALRQEFYALVVLLPLALWLGESGVERALLAGSMMIVPLVELLNSAIEATVDRFGDEHHELSGRAKDIGSAAVLLSIIIALLTWILVIIG